MNLDVEIFLQEASRAKPFFMWNMTEKIEKQKKKALKAMT